METAQREEELGREDLTGFSISPLVLWRGTDW